MTGSVRRAPSLSGTRAQRKTSPLQTRSEEHTSELQSRLHFVCRLLLENKTPREPRRPHLGQAGLRQVDLHATAICLTRVPRRRKCPRVNPDQSQASASAPDPSEVTPPV